MDETAKRCFSCKEDFTKVDFIYYKRVYVCNKEECWKMFGMTKEVREEMGAEGPADIANRVNEVVNVAARFARMYHRKHPDRKLVAWMVTHGDGLGPYAQRVLGVPEEDFEPTYNAAVAVAIDKEGQGAAMVKDVEYDAGIVQRGKPDLVS